MPAYDELLDAAHLAESEGRGAHRKAVRRLREAFPDDPAGKALEACADLARGDWEEAERRIRTMGRSPVENAARALLANAQGDEDEATRWGETALRDSSDPFVLRVASVVLGAEDQKRTRDLVGRWISARPHDPLPVYSLGMLHLVTHDLAALERLIADPAPSLAGTWRWELLRAWIAIRSRDFPLAEERARTAVALMSDHESPWCVLAMVLDRQGRKVEAGEAARVALEIDTRETTAMRILAASLDATGAPTEAEAWRRRAKESAPALTFMEPVHRSNALLGEGLKKEALAALAPLERGTPLARGMLHEHRVRILLGLSDDPALAREVESLAALAPGHPILILGRAEIAWRAGRLEEAHAILVRAWKDGRHPSVAAPLLALLNQRGEIEAAGGLAREIADDSLPDPGAAVMACLAMERCGLKAEAARLLDTSRRRFPRAQSLQVLNVAALRRSGDHAGAGEAFRRLDPNRQDRLRRRWAAPPDLWAELRVFWRRTTERRSKKR